MRGRICGALVWLLLGLLLMLSGCDGCGDDFCPIPSQPQEEVSLSGCPLAGL